MREVVWSWTRSNGDKWVTWPSRWTSDTTAGAAYINASGLSIALSVCRQCKTWFSHLELGYGLYWRPIGNRAWAFHKTRYWTPKIQDSGDLPSWKSTRSHHFNGHRTPPHAWSSSWVLRTCYTQVVRIGQFKPRLGLFKRFIRLREYPILKPILG